MKHTPEPWRVAEEPFDNDGVEETVIRGLDERAAIAVALDFGPNNPGMREANAQRIAACVNGCAGLPDEWLVAVAADGGLAPLLAHAKEWKAQRDALRSALTELMAYVPRTRHIGGIENGRTVPAGDAVCAVLDRCDAALKASNEQGQRRP